MRTKLENNARGCAFALALTRRAFVGMASAAMLAFSGCVLCDNLPPRPIGGSDEAWAAITNGAPVRAAVYVGPGARGVGAFRWMQLMDQAEGVEASFVDGEAIRNGALESADLLVMPGGKSRVEAAELGEKGQREVRAFIERGGSYVGTCAGAFLLMGGEEPEKKILAIAPFKHVDGEWGGEGMLQVAYTKAAGGFTGMTITNHTERFNGGPVMVPTKAVPGAKFKVMSRFKSNLHSEEAKPNLPSMGGAASAVAGTFGKGRVWLFSTHPEYYPKTWKYVAGAFKYLTGRDVTLKVPQRKEGQLAVGWWCKPGPGPKAAWIACQLVRDDDLDVVPYSNEEVLRTDLRHVDALVVPDAAETNLVAKLPGGQMMEKFTAFMDRGGKVYTWGAAAKAFKPHANLVVAADGADAWTGLKALKLLPPPPPRAAPAPKVAKPVRAVVYFDKGAGGCASIRWVKLLSLSPDCEFKAVSAQDVRDGALKDADLYVAPGGMSSTQMKTLQAKGCTNLVEFVRGGGGYFGTCAGCYLAMALGESKVTSGRLGMMPYKAQICPYRGGAELTIQFTDDAKMFGLKPGEKRVVRYHGGPVPLKDVPIPGADIHEIATYACDGVYSFNTNTTPVMAGNPAVLAGTFGKGRLACTSPHPESYTHTQDIIRGGLKYITGRDFKSEYPQRTRGNLSVGFFASHIHKDGATLVAELYREPSIDLRAVAHETIGYGELEHCDVLVICHPTKDDFTRYVRAFAENGGRIVLFGSEKELATAPAKLPNVVKCRDAEGVKYDILSTPTRKWMKEKKEEKR